MKQLLLALSIMLIGVFLNAEFEVGVAVKVDSTRTFSYQMSYQDALKEMKPILRRAALEREMSQAGGLASIIRALQQVPASYNSALAESLFLMSSAAGYLISEQVLKDTQQYIKGNNFRLKMEYQARVLPAAKAIPSTFKANIALEPAKPKAGEEFGLNITPAQDAWVFVFEFNGSGKFRLRYPKDADRNLVKKNSVSAHRIKAVNASEQGRQTLLVIVSKEELPGWRGFIKHTDDPDGWMDQGQNCFGLFDGWLSTYQADQRLERFIQLEPKR